MNVGRASYRLMVTCRWQDIFHCFLSIIRFIFDNNTWNNITLFATIDAVDYGKQVGLEPGSFR